VLWVVLLAPGHFILPSLREPGRASEQDEVACRGDGVNGAVDEAAKVFESRSNCRVALVSEIHIPLCL